MYLKVSIEREGKWQPVKIADFKGGGFIDFAADSLDPVIIAIYETTEDDSLMTIIANTSKLKDHYREKDIVFMDATELKALLDGTVLPLYVAKVFPDGELIEVKKLEETHNG